MNVATSTFNGYVDDGSDDDATYLELIKRHAKNIWSDRKLLVLSSVTFVATGLLFLAIFGKPAGPIAVVGLMLGFEMLALTLFGEVYVTAVKAKQQRKLEEEHELRKRREVVAKSASAGIAVPLVLSPTNSNQANLPPSSYRHKSNASSSGVSPSKLGGAKDKENSGGIVTLMVNFITSYEFMGCFVCGWSLLIASWGPKIGNVADGAAALDFASVWMLTFTYPFGLIFLYVSKIPKECLLTGSIIIVCVFSCTHVNEWCKNISTDAAKHLMVGGGFVQNGVGVTFRHAFIGITGVLFVVWNCILFLACASFLRCNGMDRRFWKMWFNCCGGPKKPSSGKHHRGGATAQTTLLPRASHIHDDDLYADSSSVASGRSQSRARLNPPQSQHQTTASSSGAVLGQQHQQQDSSSRQLPASESANTSRGNSTREMSDSALLLGGTASSPSKHNTLKVPNQRESCANSSSSSRSSIRATETRATRNMRASMFAVVDRPVDGSGSRKSLGTQPSPVRQSLRVSNAHGGGRRGGSGYYGSIDGAPKPGVILRDSDAAAYPDEAARVLYGDDDDDGAANSKQLLDADGYPIMSHDYYHHQPGTTHHYDRASTLGFALACLVVSVASVFFALIFPPIWNIPLPGHAYFGSDFVLVMKPDGIPISTASANEWGRSLNLKVFPDTLAFYLFMIFVICFSALSKYSPSLRNAFHIHVFGGRGNSKITVCLGEFILLALFGALVSFWIWYWRFEYKRIHDLPKDESWARTLGHLANLFLAFTLFPIARNSLWTNVFGIPFERAVKYHRICGVAWLVAVLAHGLNWFIVWMKLETLSDLIVAIRPCNLHMGNDNGHCDNFTILLVELMTLGAVAMVTLAHPWFRRNLFEVFFYAHHFFLVIIVVGMLHAWSLWFILVGPLALWFVDRAIRCHNSAQRFHVDHAQVTDCGHIALRLRPSSSSSSTSISNTDFYFEAGQYAFINVPAVSALQWHPFSISTAPGHQHISFNVKINGPGSWTADLANKIKSLDHVDTLMPMARVFDRHVGRIRVDGGYGKPSIDLLHREHIFLVSGGIGITPMMSFLEDFASKRVPNTVHFVHSVRDPAPLRMFSDTIHAILDPFDDAYSVPPEEGATPVATAKSSNNAGGGGKDDGAGRTSSVRGGEHVSGGVNASLHHHTRNNTIHEGLHPGVSDYQLDLRLHLHVTSRKTIGEFHVDGRPQFDLLPGRPDLKSLVEAAIIEAGGETKEVCIAVCGPAPLVASALDVGHELGVRVHTETFEL